MTYQEQLIEIKKLPREDSSAIKKAILKSKDPGVTDQLCAIWYCQFLNTIEYLDSPEPNQSYKEYMSAKQMGEASQNMYLQSDVQDYIREKQVIEAENYRNFYNLRWAYETLHLSEQTAKNKLLDKIFDFVAKAQKERIKPIKTYDFLNEQQTKVLINNGVIQRRNSKDYRGYASGQHPNQEA